MYELINFGDNTRVVYNSVNEPIAIPPGRRARAELIPVHIDMLSKAMAMPNETLMLVPADAGIPPGIACVLDLMPKCQSQDYDSLLADVSALIGPTNEDMRPTRAELSKKLRKIAVMFAHGEIDDWVPPVTSKTAEIAFEDAKKSQHQITEDVSKDKSLQTSIKSPGKSEHAPSLPKSDAPDLRKAASGLVGGPRNPDPANEETDDSKNKYPAPRKKLIKGSVKEPEPKTKKKVARVALG